MKDWWLARTSQDRMALGIVVTVVVVLLVYLLVWLPFNKQILAKRALVENQAATLTWMKKSAAEVQAIRSGQSGASKASNSNEALLTLVDRTAKQHQLRQYIQRLKPQDNETVQLWLEEAPFDTLTQWLGVLVRQYGLFLESVSIERQEKSGLVDARLTLQRESS